MSALEVTQFNVSIDGKRILNDFSLSLPKGEVHAIMGPNGTGKSTLAKALVGHKDYAVDSGTATMDGKNILDLEVDEISREGLFLAFQYPIEIPGVTIANFIRAALNARQPEGEDIDAVAYYKELYAEMERLGIDRKFNSTLATEVESGSRLLSWFNRSFGK